MIKDADMNIHPTAIVDKEADLGSGVEVKAFTMIEAGAQIGDGCVIGPHAVVRCHTIIGEDNQIHTGAVLGEPPQDRKYKGEPTKLIIGRNNIIREYVTIHRASGEGNQTLMGDDNMLMAYSHVGHNCRIGNATLIANSAGLSGHCVIEDYVNVGGMVGMHQYVTIGTMAMVGGMSRLARDVPPYVLVEGNPVETHGINWRGLSRRGVSSEDRAELKKAYRLLYRSQYNINDALAIIERELRQTKEIVYLGDFLRRVHAGYAGRQTDPH